MSDRMAGRGACCVSFGILPPDSADDWIIALGVVERARRGGIATRILNVVSDYWQAEGATRVDVGPYVPTYITPGVDKRVYPEAIACMSDLEFRVDSRPISMLALLNELPLLEKTEEVSGNSIVVRPAESADILILLGFLSNEFSHWKSEVLPVMEDQFTGFGATTTPFIALNGQNVVGFAQSRGERFGPFSVANSYRGQGIGSQLLHAVLPAMVARDYGSPGFCGPTSQRHDSIDDTALRSLGPSPS